MEQIGYTHGRGVTIRFVEAITSSLQLKTVDFYDIFNLALKERGLNQSNFARIGGVSSVFVNRLSNRKAKPPLDRVAGWAKELQMNNREAERFCIEANFCHLPNELVELLRSLLATRDDLLAKLPAIEDGAKRITELEAENKALRERIARYEPAP